MVSLKMKAHNRINSYTLIDSIKEICSACRSDLIKFNCEKYITRDNTAANYFYQISFVPLKFEQTMRLYNLFGTDYISLIMEFLPYYRRKRRCNW